MKKKVLKSIPVAIICVLSFASFAFLNTIQLDQSKKLENKVSKNSDNSSNIYMPDVNLLINVFNKVKDQLPL